MRPLDRDFSQRRKTRLCRYGWLLKTAAKAENDPHTKEFFGVALRLASASSTQRTYVSILETREFAQSILKPKGTEDRLDLGDPAV